MKVLVLGCSGMLGHQLLHELSDEFEVHGAMRGQPSAVLSELPVHLVSSLDVRDTAAVSALLETGQYDFVINAVGLIKQREEIDNAIANIEINALLPHTLANLCQKFNTRLIHFSTDCVFSGEKGNNRIEDYPDAIDTYGRAKLLGEVSYQNSLTLRTSIIGLELKNKISLIEWYLSQSGVIKGYSNAIFSGFTTFELSRVVKNILLNHPDLSGLFHVASKAIDKYTLLTGLNNRLGRKDLEIKKDEDFKIDRSLIADQFNQLLNYQAPDWGDMLDELAEKIRQRGDTFQ